MRSVYSVILPLFFLVACSGVHDGRLELVQANPEKGFHFPYFIFIPDDSRPNIQTYLIVEPNNSGFVSDDLTEHLEKARNLASNDYYLGNYLARQFDLPLLVPVFPRPEKEWVIYTHSLDRDAIMQKGNELERIDLQLVAMIEDAKDILRGKGYIVEDKVLLTGFSASGTFSNRFSLIHPEKVKAVAAGGVNGLLMLPEKELKGERLNYPVGVADFEELFGRKFDSTAFKTLPQFWFMGELDENDAIAYDDGYSLEERKLIHRLLGEEMMVMRWESCVDVYDHQGINAVCRTYERIGHEHPEEVKKEIAGFFREHLERNKL